MDCDGDFKLDFLCVGPQRTGTTWLYEMLRQHPALCLPTDVKETMYFDRRFERELGWYAGYFEHCQDDKLQGEVAPTYFDVPKVPERIDSCFPNCMIIIGLRHPAERAFSLYLHHLRKGRVHGGFWNAVQQKPRIVESGRYARHIPRWESAVSGGAVGFVFLEDIKLQPERVVGDVCDMLDIEPLEALEDSDDKINAASYPRYQWLGRLASRVTEKLHSWGLHRVVEWGKAAGLNRLTYGGGEDEMPELTPEDRLRLVEMFENDIAFVEEVTERSLPHWRE